MTDVIIGMGEVGSTIFELLTERKFDCVGIDTDNSKCKNFVEDKPIKNSEFLHISIPGEATNFEAIVRNWADKMPGLKAIVIHSTVRPGTTASIQKYFKFPVIFSPVRGVHRRFLEDVKKYSKFISSDIPISDEIKSDLTKRFVKIQLVTTTKTAELAKILVDTTYYGWLINYAQITKMICDEENIDFDEMWKFSDEIHENLGNRPKMYPGIIGGHCVIPNLNLINYEKLDIIKRINELFEKYTNSKN